MRQVDIEARELQKQGWTVINGQMIPPPDFFDSPLRRLYKQSDAIHLQRIFGAKPCQKK